MAARRFSGAKLGSMRSSRRSSPGQISARRAPRVTCARLLGGAGDDRRVDFDQVAARRSCRRPARGPGSCSVASNRYIAWNASATVAPTVSRPWLRSIRKRLVAEVAHQARLLVVAQRDAFVVVVAEARQHEDRLLRDRQHAALLRRHRDAVQRVRVQHALRVVARRVHRAVDREAGRVDRERRLLRAPCPRMSILTRLDAVISSNIRPYGLIRKCSVPGTRA